MVPPIERILRDLLAKDIIELNDSPITPPPSSTTTTSSSSSTTSNVVVTRVYIPKLLEAHPDALPLPNASTKRSMMVSSSPALQPSSSTDDLANIKRAKLEFTTSGSTPTSTPKLEPLSSDGSGSSVAAAAAAKLERLTSPSDSIEPPAVTNTTKVERSLTSNNTNTTNNGSDDMLKSLLETQSFKDRALTAVGQEIIDLVSKPSAKELITAGKFRTTGGPAVILHCPHGTKDACIQERRTFKPCDKVHWIQVIISYQSFTHTIALLLFMLIFWLVFCNS
jgi:hypothetical protein